MTADVARRAAELLEAIYTWMRQPDWADEWNIYDWATHRPSAEINEARKTIPALLAERAALVEREQRLVAALELTAGALLLMRNLANGTPALQGRQYVDLGIQVNKALNMADEVLKGAPDV